MNGRERILAMLDGGQPDCLPNMPITMMLAADVGGFKYGRYATDYHTLVEAQIRTAEMFDIDYVSCISDPTREATDCGAKIKFYDDQPPAVDEANALLADKTKLAQLKVPDPHGGGRMQDRVKAAALFNKNIGGEKLIEGWVEGPIALAADLRGINTLMLDFYDDPKFLHDLFEFAVQVGLNFAKAQVEAGAELIGIGDAAASLAGPVFYREYVQGYEQKLIEGIHALPAKVRLHICGNTKPLYKYMGELNCDIVDLDSMCPMDEARLEMGPDQVLLGNIDPVRVLRDGTPESVTEAISECHRQSGDQYIVGAGCEVPRGTPAENLHALANYARGQRTA